MAEIKKKKKDFYKYSQDLDNNLEVRLNVKRYYMTVTIVQIACARHLTACEKNDK